MTTSVYQSMANQYANQYGIPPAIFDAQIAQESGWNQSAVSSTGAIGLGQLEPGTAQQLGVNPYSASGNLQGAAMYDAQQYAHYGNWYDALQAYNGGPGNVGSAQTQKYASDVLTAAGMPATASANSSGAAYQNIINNSTGAFSAIPQGATIPQGYSALGNTQQSYNTAINKQAAAASACSSSIPGYCAIANFFTMLSGASLWEDIAAVVLGLILIGGAFVAFKSGVNLPAIK